MYWPGAHRGVYPEVGRENIAMEGYKKICILTFISVFQKTI